MQRRAMCALYAFLRKTDDLSDSDLPVVARREALAGWRGALEATLAGQPSDPILLALDDTIKRYRIPGQYFRDVMDGVEMDLSRLRYGTFAELEAYCYRVASVVGLACVHIWGFRDERAFTPARQCGIAFQLTNILRDLQDDAARGRVYLPLEDFERFGYSAEELMRGVSNEPLRHLMHYEIARTEHFYREAADLEAYLWPRGRRILRAMTATYHEILRRIKRRDGDVFHAPVRLTTWDKLRLVSGWKRTRAGAAT
jgi:phytoene synthase